MEKRWCFTLRDLDSRAPAFDHFLSLLDLPDEAGSGSGEEDMFVGGGEGGGEKEGASSIVPSASSSQTPSGPFPDPGTIAGFRPGQAAKLLKGRRIDLASIPQRLMGYDRGGDLELWELTLP